MLHHPPTSKITVACFSPLQVSQNLWYITDKQQYLHGYIDEAKITTVNMLEYMPAVIMVHGKP